MLDVTATIVDLAVRRYLKIDETGEKKLFFTKRDWTLTKLKDADDELKRYERTLFDALFNGTRRGARSPRSSRRSPTISTRCRSSSTRRS